MTQAVVVLARIPFVRGPVERPTAHATRALSPGKGADGREDDAPTARDDEYIYNPLSTDPAYLSQIWPTVVLAGVQKGGTTSLAELIMNHSGICISKRGKETHFHDVGGKGKNFLSANYPRIYGTDKKCSRAVHSGEDYTYALKRHPILAGRVHVAGRHFEGTPKLFDTPDYAQKFRRSIPYALRPYVKIIIVLREQVSRDLSAFNHMRRKRQFYWACPQTMTDMNPPYNYNTYAMRFAKCRKSEECSECMKRIVDRGSYHQHLKRWFRLFGRENVLVIQSDLIYEHAPRRVVQDTLDRVGAFLNLNDSEWRSKTSNGLPSFNRKAGCGFNGEHGYVSYECGHTGQLSSFELRDMDPRVCREMVEFYQQSNQQLYHLMRETKSQAPPQQPDFIEFQNPCNATNSSQQILIEMISKSR